MAHVTFYRKYRSRTFDEIVGQDHIIQTLKNAIRHDRLSQAYIFSGPRGTGKTSTARILAKALNCRNAEADGCCLECDLCRRIAAGNAVDIIEIDAASNTGVDNIRVLNEQVHFTPVECTYKIYIIDEAHMLSTGAFNALLKTLEEPPAFTIFILATTEPQKIPVTIHSRCQSLHFRRISSTAMLGQLRLVSDREGIEVSDQSLLLIARNSSGCLRDALSLLEQVYSFKGRQIELDDVILVLGGTNQEVLFELMEAFFAEDTVKMVKDLQKCADDGMNVSQLVVEIIGFLKDLVLVKMALTDQVEIDSAGLARYQVLANGLSLERCTDLLEIFSKLEMELKYFPDPELFVQVKFLTLSKPVSTSLSVMQPVRSAVSETVNPSSVVPNAAPSPRPSFAERTVSPPPVNRPKPVADAPVKPVSVPQTLAAVEAKIDIPASVAEVSLSEGWKKVLVEVKAQKYSLYAILNDAVPVSRTGNHIEIMLKQGFQFFKEKLQEASNQKMLGQILSSVYGGPITHAIVESATKSPQVAVSDLSSSVSGSSATIGPDSSESEVLSQPKSYSTNSINQIVEMFEGTLL